MFTTVTDGSLVLPGSFVFAPMPEAELARDLAGFSISADRLEPECNVALYRDGTNTVLFDAGAGPDFMPSAGFHLPGGGIGRITAGGDGYRFVQED